MKSSQKAILVATAVCLLMQVIDARAPKAPVESTLNIASYDAAAGVDFDSNWVVGAGSASDFQSTWASHFVCAIHAKATAEMGIVDILVKWCDKATWTPSGATSIISGTSYTAAEVTKEASLDCGSQHVVDALFFYGSEYDSSNSNNLGGDDLFYSCRHVLTDVIFYQASVKNYLTSAIRGVVKYTNVGRQGRIFAPDNHGICAIKGKFHSPASGDKFGLIGLSVLYCEICQGSSAADECYPDITNQPRAGSDGKVPPFFFTGTNIFKDNNDLGQNKISCFDQSSSDGKMVVGGMTSDPGINADSTNSKVGLPWIGLKTKEQTSAPDSWAWLAVHPDPSMIDFSVCKFSPRIHYIVRPLIVGITRPRSGTSQVHFIDPGKEGKSNTFDTWLSVELPATNSRYTDKEFSHGSTGLIMRNQALSFLEAIIYSDYSSAGQGSFSRVTLDSKGKKAYLSTFFFDATGTKPQMFGFSCVETTGGQLFFGMGRNLDDSSSAAMIFRYQHNDYQTWSYVDDDQSKTSKGFSAVQWPKTNDPSKFIDVVSLLAYYDRLVGFIHRHLATAADVQANMGDTASFLGQCDPTDFASFWRLEFKLPLKFNIWPKAMHAKDSKTSYAVVADYYTDELVTSEIYLLKFHFDPDPSDCSALVSMSEPKVTHMVSHDLCDPYDMCHFFNAAYMPSADAMAFTGTSLKFKGGLFSTQEAVGFIGAVTLAEIDAATTELPVTPFFDSEWHPNPREYNLNGVSSVSLSLPNLSIQWATATVAGIRTYTVTPDSCAGDLTVLPSSEYTSGSKKTLTWNPSNPLAQTASIGLSEIFSQGDGAVCPISSCSILQYESTAAIYSDSSASEAYQQARCRFPHSSPKLSYDSSAKAIKVMMDQAEAFFRVCVVCKNDVEAVKSEVFDLEVVVSPCTSMPIQATAIPIQERRLGYYVFYNSESIRLPTESGNVTEVVVDLLSENLITIADISACPITLFAIASVLKNDSTTAIPHETWSPYISINTATGKITISKYGNADPDLFRNISIQVEASNEFQNMPATSLVKLSFVEDADVEDATAPTFTEELEELKIEISEFGQGKPVSIKLPSVQTTSSSQPKPPEVYIHRPYEHFLSYEESRAELTVFPSEITPDDAVSLGEFGIPIRLTDEKGAVREEFLECKLDIAPEAFVKLEEEERRKQEEAEAIKASEEAQVERNETQPSDQNRTNSDSEDFEDEAENDEEEPEHHLGGPIYSDKFIGIVVPSAPEVLEEDDPTLQSEQEQAPLQAYIKDITTLGRLTIGFNRPFLQVVPTALDDEALELVVTPGIEEGANLTSLEFYWECTGLDLDEQEVYFQLNFTEAKALSPDILGWEVPWGRRGGVEE